MVYRISGICFVVAMIFLMVNPVDARWLIINTLPENASVLVDAVSAGLTPVRLEGNDGERMVVTVSLEPFADFVFEYVFEANRVMFIDLEQRVEVDEDTYWQRKTNANTLQIAHEPAKEPVMEPTHEPAEEPVEEPAGAQGGVNPDVRLVKPVLQEVTDPDPLPADLIGKQDKGISIFAVQIRRDGSVIDMKPMTEMPDDAIRLYLQRWVKTWKFNPATANGVSVEGVAQAKILFDLEKGSFAVPVLGVEKRVSMAGEVDTASDPEPEPLGEATAEETPVDEGMLGEATAEETPVDEG
ncbi:PEGA domain-containing protein, partial [bacterium]|nr:PEGA domain-containing protein [candidate division CSSED10-310 bacterium]